LLSFSPDCTSLNIVLRSFSGQLAYRRSISFDLRSTRFGSLLMVFSSFLNWIALLLPEIIHVLFHLTSDPITPRDIGFPLNGFSHKSFCESRPQFLRISGSFYLEEFRELLNDSWKFVFGSIQRAPDVPRRWIWRSFYLEESLEQIIGLITVLDHSEVPSYI
jgi:hypothetical protein